MTDRSWKGKRILVTGASSGIGEGLAVEAASEGACLILCARREDRLQALRDRLLAAGAQTVEIIAGDLHDADHVGRLIGDATGEDRLPDLVVNNAGIGMNRALVDCDPERAERLVDLDFAIPVLLTRAFGAAMARRGHGAIVNIASVAAFTPTPYHAVYASTKNALLLFSEAADMELSPRGVRVSCICPGVTDTEFFAAGDYVTTSPVYAMRRATSAQVGRFALDVAARGRRTAIHGFKNRLLMLLQRLLPRSLVVDIAGRLMRPR